MSYRTPKVQYWPSSDGLWRFCMVGANGEPQTPGQGYKTEHGCLAGIAAARRNWARAQVKRVDSAPSKRGKQ